MTINPGGVLLVIIGIAAVLIGLRGTQSSVFAALTGHSSKPASSSSATTASTVTAPAAAVQTTPNGLGPTLPPGAYV